MGVVHLYVKLVVCFRFSVKFKNSVEILFSLMRRMVQYSKEKRRRASIVVEYFEKYSIKSKACWEKALYWYLKYIS